MAGSFAWVPRPALRTAPLRLPIAAPIGAEDLCHPVPHRLPFTGQGWIFELKRDGFRALARTGVASALLSRSGRAMADPFPEVMRALSSLHRNLVLDGELVVRSERAVRLRRGSAPQPTAAAADDCRRRVTPACGPRPSARMTAPTWGRFPFYSPVHTRIALSRANYAAESAPAEPPATGSFPMCKLSSSSAKASA